MEHVRLARTYENNAEWSAPDPRMLPRDNRVMVASEEWPEHTVIPPIGQNMSEYSGVEARRYPRRFEKPLSQHGYRKSYPSDEKISDGIRLVLSCANSVQMMPNKTFPSFDFPLPRTFLPPSPHRPLRRRHRPRRPPSRIPSSRVSSPLFVVVTPPSPASPILGRT